MPPGASLQEQLQKEFCPPLDTSLIAALVNECEADAAANSRPSVTSEQIYDLRKTLSELAAQAEKDEESLSDKLAELHVSPHSFTTDESSVLTDDLSPGRTSSSDTSDASQESFSSPLGFLTAAFPQVDTALLRRALQSCPDDDGVDMESVVGELLTQEYLHDLEERGLDGLTDEEITRDDAWETVQAKKKQARAGPSIPKVAKPKARKITITDVRQQQHARPPLARNNSSPLPHGAPDPWTQLSSLSSYLSTLLPKPASYFQSIFHKPEHACPADALRAALASIAGDTTAELSTADTQSLFTIFEIITSSPVWGELDAPARKQLMADAELALRATQGQCDAALDIVALLRDLDGDAYLELGVYHSPAPAPPAREAWSSVPSSPIMSSPVLRSGSLSAKPTASNGAFPAKTKAKAKLRPPPRDNAWHQIPPRKAGGPHPLASYIPAYSGAKVRGGGNGLGKGGKGDVGELRRKRDEALREASRYWQSGSAKTRGGEVALYFAERAREYREQEKAAALDAAKSMIDEKRNRSSDKKTVDLHGTTISEATVIVKDILRTEGASPAKPLHVITGRGNHSANRVGVLGPSVRAALEQDGWVVSSFDGGLVVRGRSGRTSL